MYPHMAMLVWGSVYYVILKATRPLRSVLKMERKGFAARSLAQPWMSYWASSQVNAEASQGLPG